jgi:hypothetical protein
LERLLPKLAAGTTGLAHGRRVLGMKLVVGQESLGRLGAAATVRRAVAGADEQADRGSSA